MVHAKSKKAVGLGNTLMNDRFGRGRGNERKKTTAVIRIQKDTGEEYVTNDRPEASYVKMRSVTEQGALDEFLATAELAGTDFTAEKMNNVKIIHTDQRNPYLLSATEEKAVLGKQRENRAKLTVPRRPAWDSSTTAEALDLAERESFLQWRRGLAEMQEAQDLLMTPFERNLEVWRQLWRVIERSDVIVQIVDARNPLLFRSEDLEQYVKDVDPKKQNLLLINKADMMTYNQRKAWASYLKGAGISYKFFSAQLAKEQIEADELEQNSEGEEDESESEAEGASKPKQEVPVAKDEDESSEEDSEEDESEDGEVEDADTRILTIGELESIFLQYAPQYGAGPDRKLKIGLVGYPNVGKSSTINALIGATKVSVSATPGKTKHFQTIHLSDQIILCDCPGLVFPNFANTKAELVCNGILPIDQLREYTGPVGLVVRRIPQAFLEAIYGIKIRVRPHEEGGTGIPTAEEFLSAYARHRGFMTSGMGQPDQSRAARYVLKDYVAGKLLYCDPPPEFELDEHAFNAELYDVSHLPAKRQEAFVAAMEAASLEGGAGEDDDIVSLADFIPAPQQGAKSKNLDKAFFRAPARSAGHLSQPFNHRYSEQGRQQMGPGAKVISARKMRTMLAMEQGIDPKDVELMSGKRHFKGGKKPKAKLRTGNNNKGVDENGI